MFNYIKRLALLLTIPALMISCTEEPANDPGTQEGPPQSKVDLETQATVKGVGDIFSKFPELKTLPGDLEGEGSAEEEKLKLSNIRKPIIYGVGASGITLDTTLEESKTLLTPPLRGPFSNGVALYNEQLVVVWKTEGDRKPDWIVPIKGYLGTMTAGAFGEIGFQTKFQDYLAQKEAGAARLAKDLYNELEEVEDKSFNCLPTGDCQMIWGDVNEPSFFVVLPGAVLVLGKEEFQISEIQIRKNIEPGMLANNLDILSGDILVPGQDPISLGQTHKDIFARLNETGKSSPDFAVFTETLRYDWKGIFLLFHRTNYEIGVETSEEADVSKALFVTSEFPAYFTLGGQRILMTQTSDDISFSLESALVDPELAKLDVINVSATEVEYKLTMNTKIRKQDAELFANKFAKFLAAQLGEYDKVRYRVWGTQNDQKSNKRLSVNLSAFQSETLQGVEVGFQVNEEQEKLGYMFVGSIDPTLAPFSKVVLPASYDGVTRKDALQPVINDITNQPVIDLITKEPVMEMRKSKTFTELAGFKLNDLIKLEDIDALGRGEATATYMSGSESLGKITERSGYSDQAVYMHPENNKATARQQAFVNVSGASLGLRIIKVENGVEYGRVVSITSGSSHGYVQDVCGLTSDAKIKIGMKDSDVVAALEKVITAKSNANKDYKCEHFQVRDSGSLGVLTAIYFPQEQIKFLFDDRALTAVSIYMPLSEANTQMPASGVKQ